MNDSLTDLEREGVDAAEDGMAGIFFCCEVVLLSIAALITNWKFDIGKWALWGAVAILVIAEVIIRVRYYVFNVIDSRWQMLAHTFKLLVLYLVFLLLHKVMIFFFGLVI